MTDSTRDELQKIDPDNAGKYRQQNVVITGTDFLPPDHKEVSAMQKLIESINIKHADKHPIEWVSDLHAEFDSVHPFIDGNGRIGRLLLSILALKNSYCPVIIPPIRRAEYISSLQKTNKGDVSQLRAVIFSVIYEEMKSLKRLVQSLSGP